MWSRVIFSISGKLAKLDVFSLSIELNDIEIDLSLIKVISNRFGTSWNLLLSQKLSPKVSNCIKIEKSKILKIPNIPKMQKIPNLPNISKSSNANTRVQLFPSKNQKWARTVIFNFWRKSDFFSLFLTFMALFLNSI